MVKGLWSLCLRLQATSRNVRRIKLGNSTWEKESNLCEIVACELMQGLRQTIVEQTWVWDVCTRGNKIVVRIDGTLFYFMSFTWMFEENPNLYVDVLLRVWTARVVLKIQSHFFSIFLFLILCPIIMIHAVNFIMQLQL